MSVMHANKTWLGTQQHHALIDSSHRLAHLEQLPPWDENDDDDDEMDLVLDLGSADPLHILNIRAHFSFQRLMYLIWIWSFLSSFFYILNFWEARSDCTLCCPSNPALHESESCCLRPARRAEKWKLKSAFISRAISFHTSICFYSL